MIVFVEIAVLLGIDNGGLAGPVAKTMWTLVISVVVVVLFRWFLPSPGGDAIGNLFALGVMQILLLPFRVAALMNNQLGWQAKTLVEMVTKSPPMDRAAALSFYAGLASAHAAEQPVSDGSPKAPEPQSSEAAELARRRSEGRRSNRRRSKARED